MDKLLQMDHWLNRQFSCDCGEMHTIPLKKVVLERGAIRQIASYLKICGLERVLVVADPQTFEAAGKAVVQLLIEAGIEPALCLLAGNSKGELAADEAAIVQVMLKLNPETQAILAVGSGTIHDLVRFSCYTANKVFISIPTAPSVDGFSSVGAPLIIQGFKQTIPACAPEAIFADLDVLCGAPQAMIAAGFGDMLGKYTSLADWQLGHTLLHESHCSLAADMTKAGLELCIEQLDGIRNHTYTGIEGLMRGLILSGISMLFVGNSRPASGAEHHLSHYWEMRFLQDNRTALLHGAKVGVASILMASLYETMRNLDENQMNQLLNKAVSPTEAADRLTIIAAYGTIANQVLAENFPAGSNSGVNDPEDFKKSLVAEWQAIQHIANQVPSPLQFAQWIKHAGGPISAEQLGVSDELVHESLVNAMFVRNRFTIMRLYRWLGLSTVKE